LHVHKHINGSDTMCRNNLLLVNVVENGCLGACPQKNFVSQRPLKRSENTLLQNRVYLFLSLIFMLKRKKRAFNMLSSNFEDVEQKKKQLRRLFLLLLYTCTPRPEERPSHSSRPRKRCALSSKRVMIYTPSYQWLYECNMINIYEMVIEIPTATRAKTEKRFTIAERSQMIAQYSLEHCYIHPQRIFG